MPAPSVHVLLIPAASDRPCQVTALEYSAVAFSDAIGGGLLADIFYGNLGQPERAPGGPGEADGARRFCFYADEHRVTKRLAGNPRAAVLAARLACIDDLRCIPLAGDVLVTGATMTGDDTDVPAGVLTAAWLGGLLPDTRKHCAVTTRTQMVNQSRQKRLSASMRLLGDHKQLGGRPASQNRMPLVPAFQPGPPCTIVIQGWRTT